MTDLKKRIQNPGKEFRCDVRWWLAEGVHTDATLKKEVRTLDEDGFGAAEFLAIDELGADSTRYGWGSEEWVHDTETILRETGKRGLGASMTSGTNWSNANLPDTVHMPDNPSASKELDFTTEELKPGQNRNGTLKKADIHKENVNTQDLIAVVAAKKVVEKGNRVVLDEPISLTGMVKDGTLEWTAPSDGEYILFAFWLHGTGQTANPSVSVSYTVNYLDRFGINKLIAYWDEVVLTPALRKHIKDSGRVQLYMDSLELSVYGKGGTLWGYTLMDEFKDRRGYSLEKFLPFIMRRVSGMAMGPIDFYYELANEAKITKIRYDFFQTITELYIENMLKPMQAWLHREGMTLRAEISYGLPFEITLPGKYVDGIETESLEFASQIDSYRGLAGAAHLFNKVYSSETGATMMNYMLGLNFYTQIIFAQLASGVTKTVLHGYSSICGSDTDTFWPGHEGMWPVFSERFNERQPYYRFIKEWTNMIARAQYLLRSGKPRMDLAILRLDYNFYNQVLFAGLVNGQNEQQFYEGALMRANEGIYWKHPGLQNAGYTYDYFAPQLLEDEDVTFADAQIQPDGPGYKAVIVYQEELPLSSAKVLLTQAKRGLPVLFANGLTETVQLGVDRSHGKAASRTPYCDGKDEELTKVIFELKTLPNVREIDNPAEAEKALRELGIMPRAEFAEANAKVLTLLREDGGWRYLFVYHNLYTEEEPFTTTIQIDGEGVPYMVDCWGGDVSPIGLYEVKGGRTLVPVTLRPGEAVIIAVNTAEASGLHCVSASGGEVSSDGGKLVLKAEKSGEYEIRLSDGSTKTIEAACREAVALPEWDLTVESWTEGEKKEIKEDRGLGYVTTEVYFETAKEKIEVGKTALKPWKDIPSVGGEVSGLGFYKTTFTLPDNWDGTDGAFLELPCTSGNAAVVYINGQKAASYNVNRRGADITGTVHAGENEIRVEVASTLANQLYATGYYDRSGALSAKLMQSALGEDIGGVGGDSDSPMMEMFKPVKFEAQGYGLGGEACVRLYKRIEL